MRIGLITAGSDSPGVNVAIRGFGKAVANAYKMDVWVSGMVISA